MDSKQNSQNEVSITRIAFLYVVCLIVGGLSVLNVFLHANSMPAVTALIALAVVAAGGIVYCTRLAMRTLVA
jgi:uncharacterized protein YybS (DUF2232 family)